MNVDLFLVTYGADAIWTKYCLASARKNLTGIRNIVVVSPDVAEINLACLQYGAVQKTIKHEDPGHMQQNAIKMSADQYVPSGCDWICYIDADCIFSKPVSIDSIFVNNRPIWCYDGWEADSTYQWRKGTEHALGHPIPLNYMRRHGMMMRPDMLENLRRVVEATQGGQFYSYVMSRWDASHEWFPKRSGGKQWHVFGKPMLSEFCLMGYFAWMHYPQEFCWWRVDDFGWPGKDRNGFVRQFWSHWDVTPEIQLELERILNE